MSSKPPQPKRPAVGSSSNCNRPTAKKHTTATGGGADDQQQTTISDSTGAPREPTAQEVCENILNVPATMTKPSAQTMQKYEKKIKEVLQHFDFEGKNRCKVLDVGTIVRALNLNPNEATVLKIIEDCEEKESTGHIEYEKLSPVLMKCLVEKEYAGQILVREDEQVLRRAFSALDKEGRGWIEYDTMKTLMTMKRVDGGGSEPLSQDEITSMLDAVADPDSGRIYVDDYISLLLES